MPRPAAPKLKTRLVSRATACDALGVCGRSFSRHWTNTFTDPRDPEDRGTNAGRRVYEDELAVAVEAGGGVSGRAKVAVLSYRGLAGRKS